MAATPSTMLPLGTELPAFTLTDAVSGERWSTSRELPQGLWVMFICNHCPYVIHLRRTLVAMAHEYLGREVQVVAINSNSVQTHPQDGPAAMRALATEEQWKFPFLFDETQEVAKAFGAACTPDLFLFDGKRRLVYRGQFDDSRPSNGAPVTGQDMRTALDAMLAGQPPLEPQRPSIGCNIKWHPPAEPTAR